MFWSKTTVLFVAILVTFGKTVDAKGSYIVNYEDVADRGEPIDIVPAYSQKPPKGKGTELIMYNAGVNELATLINTGYSVEVGLSSKKTSLYVTGPAVGNDEFVYTRTIFYWVYPNDIAEQRRIGLLKGIYVQVSVLFYNTKYPSYFEAMKAPNGVVEVRRLVEVVPRTTRVKTFSNEEFLLFQRYYKLIREYNGRSVTNLKLKETNMWYLNFNSTRYYAYAGSLRNASTGEIYNCTIVIVNPDVIRISQEEYEETFYKTTNPNYERLHTEEMVYEADGRTVIDVSQRDFVQSENGMRMPSVVGSPP